MKTVSKTVSAPKPVVAPKATPVAAPKAAPTAPKAPAAPAPKAPPVAAAPKAAPTQAAPVAAGPSPKEALLMAQIEALKAEILKLQEARKTGGLKRNLVADIFANAPALAAEDDWRKPFVDYCAEGGRVSVRQFEFRGDVITPGVGTCLNVCLALPRESDVGGKGSAAFHQRLIAVHIAQSEDGSAYIGKPLYLSEEELGAVYLG